MARFSQFSNQRSEEHTSELQSLAYLVCRLLLEKKKKPHKALILRPTLTCRLRSLCLIIAPVSCTLISHFFFFNDTATTEIYTLSLHDALPISGRTHRHHVGVQHHEGQPTITFQRIAVVEIDNGTLLPVLQPEIGRAHV